MPTSTEKRNRVEQLRAAATQLHRDPQNVKLSQYLLRFLEMPFVDNSNLYYHNGVPYVSWMALQSKLDKGLEHFASHFGGEGLVVKSGSGELKELCKYGEVQHTYLRYADVLKHKRLIVAVGSLFKDWVVGPLFEGITNNPKRDYVKYHGPRISGIIYDEPEEGSAGVYFLHCGSTYAFNNEEYDGPYFILQVGQTLDMVRRLREHRGSASDVNRGTVQFLFGVELQDIDRVDAESELKTKLTALGLSRPCGSFGGRLSVETFIFHKASLPLIHHVVCGIRYAYRPPLTRKTRDHADAVENPFGRTVGRVAPGS